MARLALLLIFLGSLLPGCGSKTAGPSGPRLVILYATCSLNRAAIAPYGDVRYTPNLERFGREALVFERHTTASGQSGTDFATLFSGTQANVHGVYMHPAELPAELQLISETFGESGYEPHFWSGHGMASIELGYGQGVAPENAHVARGRKKKVILQEADPTFRTLLDRLEANPEQRAFVFANFTMTHSPYDKMVSRAEVRAFLREFPEEARGVTTAELDEWLPIYGEERFDLQWNFPATARRLELDAAQVERLAAVLEVVYRAAVCKLDTAFGGMLAALEKRGLAEDALIVFTADHGELLYRENALFQWTHGLQLSPEVLDVPLMMRAPGLAPGRYEAVTRSIDVYPSMAGWCGVPIPDGKRPHGADLSPPLRGEREAPRLQALSHSTTLTAESLEDFGKKKLGLVLQLFPRTDPELIWVRVRRDDLVAKLVDHGSGFEIQVFDLATDRGETHNLYDAASPLHAGFERTLRKYKQALVDGFVQRGGQEATSEELLAELRELGYIGDEEEAEEED
jgi:arylsulfatase A-like enzyme